MWSICSKRVSGARRLVAGIAVLAIAGCAHVEAPAHPRPSLPLPPDLVQRYALPGPVVEESLVPIGGDNGIRFYRGRLRCGDELAEFHYLHPENGSAQPFVLCLPILAGGRALMWILATSMAERGYAVAWSERVASALKPGQRGHELEQLFRRTITHNRMILEWVRGRPDIDPERQGCIGLSMGGMIGAVLLAVEPELRGGALCLAGGDLGGIMLASAEPRARNWRRWRHEADGAYGEELRRELRELLVSDPALIGPYVETERVLLVGGALDDVVPPHHQDLLWESFGRPERHVLPLGHYTAVLAFDSMVDSVDGFLERRFEQSGRHAAGRP